MIKTASQLILVYGSFFVASVLFALFTCSLLLKFATNLGMRHNTAEIRWAPSSKPSLGGFVFYILFLLSMVVYLIVFSNLQPLAGMEFMGLVLACTMGFLMGLTDDAYNTPPILKFFVQLLCAGALIATENHITLFDNIVYDYPLTVIWVVGIMNSINMLDNMDAITGSTTFLIVCGGLVYLILSNMVTSFYFVILIGMAAALCGFLYYNWHPSKMYMGDTGSMFLGAFLATIGIKFCWNGTDFSGQEIAGKQILMVLLFFIVPISDTATVTINRLMQGKSPFVGGRDHTTHNLVYLGLKDRHVALVLGMISLICISIAISLIYFKEDWYYGDTLLYAIIAIIFVGGLYSTTKLKKKNHGRDSATEKTS